MKFDKLEITDSITVKHPDAPHGLTILATKSGAGLWAGGKQFATVQNIDGQILLAVGTEDNPNGHQLAIFITADGEPALQLCRPGKGALILTGDRLTALFEGSHASESR